MALADTLTLEDSANAAITYSKTRQDLHGSEYIATFSTSQEPSGLYVKHSVSGKGKDTVDRHLLQFYKTKLDVETLPRTCLVNLTIALPRSLVTPVATPLPLLANLVDFLLNGGYATNFAAWPTTNTDKILRGEQ